MPLVLNTCTPCTCMKAKTAEQYASCLAACAKVTKRCPPEGLAAGPTDQTGLGYTEPGEAELVKLKAARDAFVGSVNKAFAGPGIRVRLVVERDPNFGFVTPYVLQNVDAYGGD